MIKIKHMKKLILVSLIAFNVIVANAQWQQTSLASVQVNCIAISGNNIFAGIYEGGYGSVALFTNDGTNWTGLSNGFPEYLCNGVNALAISGTNVFAGTGDSGVYFSSNNGSNWSPLNNGLPFNTLVSYYDPITSFIINGTNILAGTYMGGIYLSPISGNSWAATTGCDGYGNTVDVFSISGDTILAGSSMYGVYLSSDNGGQWFAWNTGLISTDVQALAINGRCIFAGTGGDGVFLSTNNGVNWSACGDIGLTNGYINALAVSGSNIFAGTNGGVFLSKNNGSSWSAMNNGLIYTNVFSLAINGSYIFAGTDSGGVWRFPLSTVGIEEINNACNIAVFPNPVADNLQIQTTLQIKEIEIVDITGRLLYTTTEKTINCSNFAKGVYFITLTTEKGKAIKKFIKE